ncbi:serine protease [bacterium]|nr:serine protease [bacterium]
MGNKRNSIKIVLTFLAISILPFAVPAQQSPDWVSDRTIAAVVKLGKVYDYFIVENMPDNHIVKVNYDTVDFGGGKVIKRERVFQHVGSGVIVNPDGWIFSNAHVANDTGQFGIRTQQISGADAKPVIKNGISVKAVAIPVDTGFMWVSMTKEEDLRKNVRRSSLEYLAKTFYVDDDFMNFNRDRAILKIVSHAKMDLEKGLPQKLNEISDSDRFPYVQMENPFDVSIHDPKIRSIGFPGIGPQDFPAITSGEYLGPESNTRSHILHTAFIAGGNSGGGLFYKDKLIGINTWSKPDLGTGRSVSSAQPNTYWGYPIAAVQLWANTHELPGIPNNWLKADPSTDPYKNRIYAGFNICSRYNEAVKIKNTGLLVFGNNIPIAEAAQYIQFEEGIKVFFAIKMAAAQGVSIMDLASHFGMDFNTVKALVASTEDDFFAALNPQQKRFLQTIISGEFFASVVMIDKEGQAIISVPPVKDFKLAVVFNSQKIEIFDFSSGSDIIQGPWTIRVNL